MMKVVLFAVLSILCLPNSEEYDQHRLILNVNEVQKITYLCQGSEVVLSPTNQRLFIESLNSATGVGMVKGIVQQQLIIYLQNHQAINIRMLGNLFKWDGGGDYAFRLGIDEQFIANFCGMNE